MRRCTDSVFPFLPQKGTTAARIRTELVAEKEPFQNVNNDHEYAQYLDIFRHKNLDFDHSVKAIKRKTVKFT